VENVSQFTDHFPYIQPIILVKMSFYQREEGGNSLSLSLKNRTSLFWLDKIFLVAEIMKMRLVKFLLADAVSALVTIKQ